EIRSVLLTNASDFARSQAFDLAVFSATWLYFSERHTTESVAYLTRVFYSRPVTNNF
ncbi:MAG: hypothetical protein RL556_265, partial [Actinomycetota bacterium]